jgi:putative membrane protein
MGFNSGWLEGQYKKEVNSMMNWNGTMGNFGWVGMLIGLMIVILFIVILFNLFGMANRNMPDKPLETPLDILKKRYANGEITKDEYEEMRVHLNK